MLQKFVDYIKELNISNEAIDIDFSDLAFAYDYNEVQELFFDETKNNYVFITGETGLRKKDMLARICKDLILRGIEKQDMLYLDHELPILHGEDIFPLIQEFYYARKSSKFVYLVVNEIQELGDWFSFVQKLKTEFLKLKLLCSSSTPPYIFETIYDEHADYCKIIVLSQKNVSNIKYQTQTFGVYNEFKYNQKDGFIEIKGMTKEGKKMPYHTVPETINGVPVKIIASGAFHDRSELLSIMLPDSIEMIGDYAFSKCNNLKEIRLPKSLTYIGEHAFLGAKSLCSVIGGDKVIHIGNSAFYDTEWLKNQPGFAVIGSALYKYKGNEKHIVIPHGISHISSYAFANSYIESITANGSVQIGEGSFYNCRNLKHTDIEISSIPPFTFYNCQNLTEKFTVDEVGKFGLYGCTSLSEITAKNLDVCAMTNCTALKQLNGVRNVLTGALWNSHKLNCIDVSGLVNIGICGLGQSGLEQLSFSGINIGAFAFYNSKNLRSISIKSCTSLGKGCLYKCDSVHEMEIVGSRKLSFYFAGEMPKVEQLTIRGDIVDDFCRNNPYLKSLTLENIRSFGRWSFYNNSVLQTVILKNVKKIGDWAFAYCDFIKKIELPEETEYIGMNAFRYCHNLADIKTASRSVVTFGANAFYSTDENKLFYVPKELITQYKSVPLWEDYMNNIEEL